MMAWTERGRRHHYKGHSAEQRANANWRATDPSTDPRDHLRYDAETGLFWWRRPSPKRNIYEPAGSTQDRYTTIVVCGKRYYAHRLAWMFVHGEMPCQIDHINGVNSDNRIANLRSVTPSQNMANVPMLKSNKSGYRGVFWSNTTRRWLARIKMDGKTKHLGSFDAPEKASAAYMAAAEHVFGEYLRRPM